MSRERVEAQDRYRRKSYNSWGNGQTFSFPEALYKTSKKVPFRRTIIMWRV